LNIKYNKAKQHLKDDPILDSLFSTKEFFVKNSNQLLGAVVVILVLIAGFLVFNNVRKSGENKASESFGKAMIYYTGNQLDKAAEQFKLTAENHGSSQPGALSAFLLGRILYDQGKYDDAIEWYSSAAKGARSIEFVGGQALEGIAACYEAKGDTKSAVENLEKALKDDRIKFRHSTIKWKIALMDGKSEKSRSYLKEIVSDTTAIDLHQRAENLLASMDTGS
jgi:predicted negative regulator of RcsB-dependent stress response